MSESIPIVILVIAGILVVLALLALRIRSQQKGEEPRQPIIKNKKAFYIPFGIGIAISLMAAFFMFDGDILGENTTGIATVIGIVGIGLIATSNVSLFDFKRRKKQ